MAKLRAKSATEAKKKGKLAKENVPPKTVSSESDGNESHSDDSVEIGTKGPGPTAPKMANVKQQSSAMEDENDASATSQSYEEESQTEAEEEPPQKAKTQQTKKNAKTFPKPPTETETESDGDHEMAQESRSESETESNEEPSPLKPNGKLVQPVKPMPQAKNVGKTMKMNPPSQSESDSGTEDDEEEAQAPKQVPGKKKPAPSKPAPKAATKAKVVPQKGKATAKKILAPLAVEVKTPPTVEMKAMEKKPPAKAKAVPKEASLERATRDPRAAAKNKKLTKMVAEKALPPPKSIASKTTKGAKETNTTVAAASKKTVKSANDQKGNQTAASVAKATTKKNRRLSKVSSLISKKDTTKMTIGDKVILAIVNLNEDAGSSLRNIINYMSKTYQMDKEKFAKRIRSHLKKFYAEGILVQKRNTDFNINRKFRMSSKKYKNMVGKNDENADNKDMK